MTEPSFCRKLFFNRSKMIIEPVKQLWHFFSFPLKVVLRADIYQCAAARSCTGVFFQRPQGDF